MAPRLERLFDRYRRHADGKALAAVFDRTAPEVLRIAMHFARAPADAEDLVQRTYLTAIERARSFDVDRRLMPWLLGILRNHVRSDARKKRPDPISPDMPAPLATEADPLELVEWSRTIAETIEVLPARYRQVLVLRLRHRLEPAAIADVLGLGAATVRTQLHRGLIELRARLAEPETSLTRAVLPIGVGLVGIREQVLAHAAALPVPAAVVASAAPTTLLGVAMTKMQTTGLAAVALCLALGATAWMTGVFNEADAPPASAPVVAAGDAETQREAPVLVARGDGEGEARASDPAKSGTARGAAEADPISASRGSVKGIVRFEDGAPLANATVRLRGRGNEVRTDAKGRFRLDNEAVWSEQFLMLDRDGVRVALAPIEMKLGALVEVVLVLKRGLDLDIAVRDRDTGAAIASVHGSMKRAQKTQGHFVEFFATREGRVRVPHLPVARYRVSLQHPEYENREFEIDLARDMPTVWKMRRANMTAVRIENAPDAAQGAEIEWVWVRHEDGANFHGRAQVAEDVLRVKLPPPATYSLSLRESRTTPRFDYRRVEVTAEGLLEPLVARFPEGGTIEGTLHSEAGTPLAEHRVTLGRNEDQQTQTDAHGRFRFAFVPVGEHDLFVQFKAGRVSLAQVPVEKGEIASATLVAKGHEIRGRVLVGAEPMHRSYGGLTLAVDGAWRTIAMVRPKRDGSFVIPYVPTGDYHLGAWTSEGTPISQRVQVAQSIDVGTLRIEPFLRIPLEIDAGSATPPNQIAVRAWVETERGWMRAQVVGRGVFALSPSVQYEAGGGVWLTGVPKRFLRLEFSAQGFAPAKVEVANPSSDAPIRVRMHAK